MGRKYRVNYIRDDSTLGLYYKDKRLVAREYRAIPEQETLEVQVLAV